MSDLLLRACRGESVSRPPVWLMRQAGRYLPEYQALRSRHSFLALLETPELATEVTLQPVRRLGVDAAIVFSDILVIPAALGQRLTVEDGVGPRLEPPIRSAADLKQLRPPELDDRLGYLFETIRLTRRELGGTVPLIGFAGGPWTLAAYMIEGGGVGTPIGRAPHIEDRASVRLTRQEPALVATLLDQLTEVVGDLLIAEAGAGAQVLQVFESAAGLLGPAEFRSIAVPRLARVVERARSTGCPVIVFAPGAGWALEDLAHETGADVIGLDWATDPAQARLRLPSRVLQGNLDPALLLRPADQIARETGRMIDVLGPDRYIANLGHGVPPTAPVANVQAFVDAVKGWPPG